MNRRGFFGTFAAAMATAKMPAAPQEPPIQVVSNIGVPVLKADGTEVMLGVAMQSVNIGDLVTVQTHGPRTVAWPNGQPLPPIKKRGR